MSASLKTWRDIERVTGLTLPEAVRRLYEQTPRGEAPHRGARAMAGAAPREERCMRLLSPAQACKQWKLYGEVATPLRGGVPIWESSNGDRAFVFCEGPLVGKVFWIDYALQRTPAVFRSADSFRATMNAVVGKAPAGDPPEFETDWSELPTDYVFPGNYYYHYEGVPNPTTPAEAACDLEARAALECEWRSQSPPEDDDERCEWVRHYAQNFCVLTPADHLVDLLPILGHEAGDEWGYAQAVAAEVLGLRRAEFAVDALGEAARTGRLNGPGAAVGALQRIGTSRAIEMLRRLAGEGVEDAKIALRPQPELTAWGPYASEEEYLADLKRAHADILAQKGLETLTTRLMLTEPDLHPKMMAEAEAIFRELPPKQKKRFKEVIPMARELLDKLPARFSLLEPTPAESTEALIEEMLALACEGMSPAERAEFEKMLRADGELPGQLHTHPSSPEPGADKSRS